MVLEERVQTKWIFRYLRGDRNEVEMGPYKTRTEAQTERDRMASFGAMCSDPIEVAEDYVPFRDEPGDYFPGQDFGL